MYRAIRGMGRPAWLLENPFQNFLYIGRTVFNRFELLLFVICDWRAFRYRNVFSMVLSHGWARYTNCEGAVWKLASSNMSRSRSATFLRRLSLARDHKAILYVRVTGICLLENVNWSGAWRTSNLDTASDLANDMKEDNAGFAARRDCVQSARVVEKPLTPRGKEMITRIPSRMDDNLNLYV